MNPVTVLCISSFFSAWGDRLWGFGVGLYLVKLTPGSLQLAALYGLSLTSIGIIFSPLIGDWIDRNNRLKVVRITLVLQNLLVILCALTILAYLFKVSSDPHILRLMQAVIILIGSLANLAGQGEKISVTKDWIVVICADSKDKLANANAMLRRVDLFVAISAPIGVGLLMSVISDLAGIMFICCWNILSMFAEYFLLQNLYNAVPDLSQKWNEPLNVKAGTSNVKGDSNIISVIKSYDRNGELENKTKVFNENDPFLFESTEVSISSFNRKSTFSLRDQFRKFYYGWKIYWDQSVFLAGVGLSLLYLTVLGFNTITTSYAYSQGLKEVYVSICFAFGSLVGVGATFLFPMLRTKIGLEKTGICGNLSQLSMLLLCVASIWLPGSPSSLLQNGSEDRGVNSTGNSFFFTSKPTTSTILASYTVQSGDLDKGYSLSDTSISALEGNEKSDSINISIIVFMIGIILSRAGLWLFDLTVTQLQQENVGEEERGTVGGVQYALCSFLELLHYVATICLPYPSQFWILIFMSISAVILCTITYISFHARHRSRDYEEIK